MKQPKPRKVYGRERGYTDAEAVQVLKASRSYQPKADEFGHVREKEKAANLKRWVPILCAFTGARVSEITQLRKEDIRELDGHMGARITPDAGTVKAGGYRDVPLHPQIIAEGLRSSCKTPLNPAHFSTTPPTEESQSRRIIVSNKLSDWLRLKS